MNRITTSSMKENHSSLTKLKSKYSLPLPDYIVTRVCIHPHSLHHPLSKKYTIIIINVSQLALTSEVDDECA